MSDDDQVILIYTTWPEATSAEMAGAELVAGRLAACVNILAPATSVYEWRGNVERATEVPMLIKTVAARLDDVTAAVRRLHPYDVPAIAAVPVVGGNGEFLDWIGVQSKGNGQ